EEVRVAGKVDLGLQGDAHRLPAAVGRGARLRKLAQGLAGSPRRAASGGLLGLGGLGNCLRTQSHARGVVQGWCHPPESSPPAELERGPPWVSATQSRPREVTSTRMRQPDALRSAVTTR